MAKAAPILSRFCTVDQAAEDCHGDLDSGHDGICHAQYGHHVDDHEVLREEQDSYQGGPGIEGYNFHLIAGFRMVGFLIQSVFPMADLVGSLAILRA